MEMQNQIPFAIVAFWLIVLMDSMIAPRFFMPPIFHKTLWSAPQSRHSLILTGQCVNNPFINYIGHVLIKLEEYLPAPCPTKLEKYHKRTPRLDGPVNQALCPSQPRRPPWYFINREENKRERYIYSFSLTLKKTLIQSSTLSFAREQSRLLGPSTLYSLD